MAETSCVSLFRPAPLALSSFRYHPWWRESEVVAFCNKHGILVEAYAPVGDGDRSHMRDAPIFAQLAAQHNVTVGQMILSWDLQSGADIVIPRSATAQHQVDNLNLFGPGGVPVVTLSSNEVAAISSNHTYGKVYHTDCKCVRALLALARWPACAKAGPCERKT